MSGKVTKSSKKEQTKQQEKLADAPAHAGTKKGAQLCGCSSSPHTPAPPHPQRPC